MKRSYKLNTSLAGLTILSATVIAGSLFACSSGSTRDGFETSSSNPTDPSKPGASAPSTPGSDGPTAAAPDSGTGSAPEGDCKVAPPTNMCGVSPQCGCAAGKTCDVVSMGGSARCVSAGESPMGHPCSATAECGVGMTCIFGTCHAFCNNPGEQCSQPGTGPCVQVKTTEGADVPNLQVCRVACEPHDPATCGGAVCIIDADGNTECQTGGSKAEGETCAPGDECGPGLGCVTGADKKSTCKRWCRLGETDCGAGKTCTGFNPEIVVRGTAYGSCN